MGKGVNIPSGHGYGGRYTMDRGVCIPWVGGSKYHLSNNKEFRFFSDWHFPNSTSELAVEP